MKKLFFFIFLGAFSLVKAQENNFLKNSNTTWIQNNARFNYMVLSMPEDKNTDATMALGGMHYLIPFASNFYTGFNLHAALFGDQGGLFTIGTMLGYSRLLFSNYYLDTNFNFGGGGGYRNLINKGAYVNPNIGIAYHWKKVHIGAQFSHFNFYTGSIQSNAISFYIELPSPLMVSSYKERGKNFKIKQAPEKNIRKSSFSVKLDQYFPFGKTRKDAEQNNELLRNILYLIGFEYQKYLHKNTFLFLHTDAMYKGLVAGFMDVFGGFGLEPIQSQYVNFYTKLGIGAAGGRIRAEGGATIYPSIGFDIHLNSKISFFGQAGYTKALDGYFEAYTLGGGIKYHTYSIGSKNQFNSKKATHVKTTGIRTSIQHQTYFGVQRMVREPIDLHLLALQVNYDIHKYIYVTGQAAFAYESTYKGNDAFSNLGAGGYADGMVGFGVYSPIFAKQNLQFFTEALIGAGGGAGIATGEGIISKVKIGTYVKVNPYLHLLVSGGKVISPSTNLNSNNINLGLSVNFSTLTSIFK